MDPLNSAHFRQVLGQYPTGVTVITAMGTEPLGMVVGTFSSVSMDPPLVCFMPTRGAGAWKAIQASGDRFCVNILSEDQGEICGAIATRWENRFDGIPFSLSESGQPVIHGAVAYLDCTVHQVVEAGDHDIVVGRVESLNVLSSAYPLLFFRGGYGAFQPSTLTSRDTAIRSQLSLVTPCRGVMEELAEELDTEVTVLLRAGDEVILAAAAGRSELSTVPTRVGQRLPFAPPIGSLDAALGGQAAEARWLAASSVNGLSRAESADMLRRVRERGYSIAFDHHAHELVEKLTAKRAGRNPEASEEELHGALAAFARNYNRDLEPGEQVELRYVNAPVYMPDGTLAFGLTLWGPKRVLTAGEVQKCVDLVVASAATCTDILAELLDERLAAVASL